jgi:hypothetical protein
MFNAAMNPFMKSEIKDQYRDNGNGRGGKRHGLNFGEPTLAVYVSPSEDATRSSINSQA